MGTTTSAAHEAHLKACAEPDCYGCRGTGRIVGFGHDGAMCSCVATCWECGEPFAWERDDESPPKKCPRCAEDPGDAAYDRALAKAERDWEERTGR